MVIKPSGCHDIRLTSWKKEDQEIGFIVRIHPNYNLIQFSVAFLKDFYAYESSFAHINCPKRVQGMKKLSAHWKSTRMLKLSLQWLW